MELGGSANNLALAALICDSWFHSLHPLPLYPSSPTLKRPNRDNNTAISQIDTMIVTVNNNSNAAMDKELLDACKEGNIEEVQRLVEAGADLSTKDGSGLTALHLAAWNGHTKTAAVLLEHGALVHAKSNYGSTPLHAASDKGHHETAQLLLNKSATVDATNNGGLTPLHYGKFYIVLGAEINLLKQREQPLSRYSLHSL